jgi:selenide,water dikinase
MIQKVGVRAVTDITGFALLGHSHELAEASSVRLRLHVGQIPFLEGAREYADMWLFPGGTCDNERGYEHAVSFAPGIEEEMQQLLYTPETSGGLMVAVPPEKLDALTALFNTAGHPCWVIGEVAEGEGVEVVA